jgi:hypothetical protein
MYTEDIYTHLFNKINHILLLENNLENANLKISQLNQKVLQNAEKFPDSSTYTNNS